MHTAFDCSPLLTGYKEKPEAILVHGAKLFIGSSTGNLSVYRIDQSSSEPSLSAIQPLSISEPIQVSAAFSKRAIEQLGVIKETNTLVSLSDGYVSLHDLSTLGPQLQLTQTRGALTFCIDTSIQKQVSTSFADYGPGPLGSRNNAGTAGGNQAFRPGAAIDSANNAAGTIPRSRSGSEWQTASMRGMDALAKHKDQERKRAVQEARNRGARTERQDGVMTLVTVLVVGLKRKTILFRWVDGEFWDTREIGLAHTPRNLTFPTPTKLFMGYNVTEYGVLSVPLASDSTVVFTHPALHPTGDGGAKRQVYVQPPSNSVSGPLVDTTAVTTDAWHLIDFDISGSGETGRSATTSSGLSGNAAIAAGGFGAALGGLGGYIGMGIKRKPMVLQVDGGEVLVVRDQAGIFFGADGKPTRRDGIEWPASPEEVAFARPYVFSILPSGSVPSLKQSQLPNANYPVLQIRSVSTLVAVQTLCFPPMTLAASTATATPTPTSTAISLSLALPLSTSSTSSPPSVRLLTTSATNKPPVYVVVSPTERGAQERQGSTIWRLDMQGWARQIDELIEKQEFEEALGLLDSVGEVILEDKAERRAFVQSLYAISLFSESKYDEAIEIFMELDINPAKVLALYPQKVAGDLSRDKQDWFPIFGGKKPSSHLAIAESDDGGGTNCSSLSSSPSPGTPVVAPQSTARNRLGSLLVGRRPPSIVGESMLASAAAANLSQNPRLTPSPSRKGRAEDLTETASIRSGAVTPSKDVKETEEASRKSLDALGRFLADRRRIFKPILESIPQLESRDHMTMSQIKRDSDWLLSLPNKPLGELEKDELMAVAQTVDTALFKTFLETKPALIGPLCRVENWCEVEQVEELLKERNKFSELIALYGGKEMHYKALQLLKQFSESEQDGEEKIGPTIRYLQNLGSEFIDIILDTSHWVLEQDAKMGMEIFMADTGKVASLPRLDIVADLEQFDKDLCAEYLEYIIDDLGEADPELHDKLIRLYLVKASSIKQSDQGSRATLMKKLLKFLRNSTQYRPEQILGRLPADDNDRDMFEARALLLGRMGQHEGALGIYVRKLNDLQRAEEYCKDVWNARKRTTEQEALEHGLNGRRLVEGGSGGRYVKDRSNEPTRTDPAEVQRKLADEQVFLTLLGIYLRKNDGNTNGRQASDTIRAAERLPTAAATNRHVSSSVDGTLPPFRLDAALSLIERHASKIDLISALELLPPLVSVHSMEKFVKLSLRDQTRQEHEVKVVKQMNMMRGWQVDETLCRLQKRRVKVGESRTCPRCHKRLGNSVIAVQPMTGAVMHYFCMLTKSDSHTGGEL